MTTQPGPSLSPRPTPTVDEIFAKATPITSIDELSQDGILADLRQMRRSNTA